MPQGFSIPFFGKTEVNIPEDVQKSMDSIQLNIFTHVRRIRELDAYLKPSGITTLMSYLLSGVLPLAPTITCLGCIFVTALVYERKAEISAATTASRTLLDRIDTYLGDSDCTAKLDLNQIQQALSEASLWVEIEKHAIFKKITGVNPTLAGQLKNNYKKPLADQLWDQAKETYDFISTNALLASVERSLKK